MNKILLLLLLTGICGFSQNDTIWYDSDWKPTVKENAEFFRPPAIAKGNKFIIADYYAKGTLQMMGISLKQNEAKWDGVVTWYNHEGMTESEANFANGIAEGNATIYHPNGKVKATFNNRNGRREGELIEYHDDGSLYGKVNYKNGEPDGLMKQFYPNGQLEVTKEYVNGVQEGKEIGYFEDGKTKYTGTVVNGEPVGEFLEYHSNGSVSEKTTYFDGKRTGRKIYNRKGNEVLTILPDARTANGRAESIRTIKEILARRNVAAKQDALVKPTRSGNVQIYDENKRIVVTGTFNKGKRYGNWEYFNESGNAILIENYHHGYLHETQQFFDSKGRLEFEVKYHYGDLHGKAIAYDENAEPKAFYFFILGKLVSRDEFEDNPEPGFSSGSRSGGIGESKSYSFDAEELDGALKSTAIISLSYLDSDAKDLSSVKFVVFDSTDAGKLSELYKKHVPETNEVTLFFAYDQSGNAIGEKKYKVGESMRNALKTGSVSTENLVWFLKSEGFSKAAYWNILQVADLENEIAKP